jgi:hypothetical protein
MVFSSFCTRMTVRREVVRKAKRSPTHQVVENTLVEGSFEFSALPELLVVVVQTRPVFSELFETVLVNVAQTVYSQKKGKNGVQCSNNNNIHASGASSDLAALLQAIELSLSIGIGLAHHVVVIERLASCTDKERGRE